MKKILCLMSAALLSACAPAIIGGGTVLGTSAVSEKGITGAFSDTYIANNLRVKFYNKDPLLYHAIGIEVHSGEVMLTGAVPTDAMHIEAVRLTWEVKGVKRIIDNLSVSQGSSAGVFANDSWITTKIRSTLLFDKEIPSVNYSITTVEGVVYVMGIAQNAAEHTRVTETIRNTAGVRKVVSYVQVKGNPAAAESNQQAVSAVSSESEPAEYPVAS